MLKKGYLVFALLFILSIISSVYALDGSETPVLIESHYDAENQIWYETWQKWNRRCFDPANTTDVWTQVGVCGGVTSWGNGCYIQGYSCNTPTRHIESENLSDWYSYAESPLGSYYLPLEQFSTKKPYKVIGGIAGNGRNVNILRSNRTQDWTVNPYGAFGLDNSGSRKYFPDGNYLSGTDNSGDRIYLPDDSPHYVIGVNSSDGNPTDVDPVYAVVGALSDSFTSRSWSFQLYQYENVTYAYPLNLTSQLQLYMKHNDAGTYLWDEMKQRAGTCAPAGCGQNPYSYYGYYKPKFDGKFDESSLFPQGTYGKSCHAQYSVTGISNGLTMTTWFKPDFYKSNTTYMYPIEFEDSECNSNPFRGSRIYFNANNVAMSYSGGTLSVPYNLTSNEWYMFTATWGADGMKLYVNGELIGSDPTKTGYTTYSWLFFDAYGSYALYGVMDETAVWSRQLKDFEVEYLYNNGTGKEIFPANKIQRLSGDTMQDGVISYHSFDVSPVDDLGLAEYPRTSVDVLHDDPKAGDGYLYCRGSSRTLSTSLGDVSGVANGYTVGAWLRAPNDHAQTNYIYQAIQSSYISGSYIPFVDGYAPMYNPELNYTGDINDSSWHLAISVYVPEEKRLYNYYDGQLIGSTYSSVYPPVTPPTAFAVCRALSGQSSYADVDEFFVYDRAISDSEIATIYAGYQMYSGGTPPEECRDVLACPLRWYSLDELNGTVVADSGLDGVESSTTISSDRPLGFINRALSLTDTTQSITFDNTNTNLSFYDVSDYSISFWYYKGSNPSSTQRFFDHKAVSSGNWWTYFYQLNGGQIQYCVGRLNIDGQCLTSSVLGNGWNMITATFNHTDFSMNLYVNTTNEATNVFERVNTIPSDTNWQVYELTAGREYQFSIDEIRFYDWEIQPEDVQILYDWSIENSGCNEEWIPEYTTCGYNNSQTLTYYDANACGTFVDLPLDNGTSIYCDYCQPEYHEEQTGCLGFVIQHYNVMDNQEVCCALTGLSEDCDLPMNYTTPCNEFNQQHESSDIGGLIIDFLVEYWLYLILFAGLLILLFLYLLWRYLRDNGYI